MPDGGISLGNYARIENITAEGNDFGISVGDYSIVRGCQITNSPGDELSLGIGSGYYDNVISNGATGGVAVSGGRSGGGNFCDDTRCAPTERRFYLTFAFPNGAGANAPGVCAPGFHFASMWEIHDVSNLAYDTSLGQTHTDSGSGPISTRGWIRTGGTSSPSSTVGRGNCSVWTSSATADFGTVVSLDSPWSAAAPAAAPWEVATDVCSNVYSVWCVED